MRVRDLGALVVAVDGVERSVVGSRAATILALLVINANNRVSVQALLDATWGDRATESTVSTLESHVWRLRQLLEPGRANGQAPAVLINENGGYRLIAAGHAIDSVSLAESVDDVRDLLAAGRAAAAAARADDGLALWRGQPYGALGEQPWAQPAVARLEELRWQLNEHRIDALVEDGRLDRALADLEVLIAAMPFREKLRAQQMLALYRSGRIEEALASFQRARDVLVDEVGTEPGPELTSLHLRILDHSPDLDNPERRSPTQSAVGEVHLPVVLTPLIGREIDLDRLIRLLAREPLVTIAGAAGVGKTRLAIDVGRLISDDFPDGVWFIDLAAVTGAELVVDAVLSTIGIATSAGATPLEDLTHYLRGRRLLLILDNCEHVVSAVAHIVRIVLGGARDVVRCSMLATSREPLDIDGEITWVLQPLGFPDNDSGGEDNHGGVGLNDAPAVRMFLERLSRVVPAMAVDDGVVARAAAICRTVDGVPLAIELAAAWARSHSLGDIEERLRTDLGEMGRPGPARRGDPRVTVRSSIESSHRLLTSTERLVHRRLAVLPGSFTSEAAVAVGDLPGADTEIALSQLVYRSMLTSTAGSDVNRRTVFRQLATVRAHAGHVLREADEVTETTGRRDIWVGNLINGRPRLGARGEAEWFSTLDDNYSGVRASLASVLLENPVPAGSSLAAPLGFYWYYRARLVEASRWLQLACSASADRGGSGWLASVLVLASALAIQGRVEAARPHIRQALGLVDAITDGPHLIEVGEALVALGAGVWVHEVHDLVIDVHAVLHDVAQRCQDADLQLFADTFECMAWAADGRLDQAAERATEVYCAAEKAGNQTAGWMAAATPMTAALHNSRPEVGIPWVQRVMQAHLRLGGATAGMFVETRANYETQRGSYVQATRLYAAARAHTRRAAMVWPRRPITGVMLQEARNQLRQADFEAAWSDGEQLELVEIAHLG